MKFPARLTYAAFRRQGITRRFLFCKTEETPRFGDPTFDFLGYFGFGSGEFTGAVPDFYHGVRVEVKLLELPAEEALLYLSQIMERHDNKLYGFITHDGQTFRTVTETDGDAPALLNLSDLNWAYYTQVGDRALAVAHILTLNRRHILFETPREQDILLQRYAHIAGSI